MKQYKAIDTEVLNEWIYKLSKNNSSSNKEVIEEIEKELNKGKQVAKGQLNAKLNKNNTMEF